MTRPRKLTSRFCAECHGDPVHAFQHRRLDKRRAQWRAYARRKRNADGRIGTLHDLRCKGPRHCTCNPIPVYSEAVA